MRKIVIALLALTLAPTPGSFAAPAGSLAGRVLPAADRPVATRVWISPYGSKGAPIETPVAVDGSFAVAGLPAGTVELAIETSEGLYPVNAPIAIAPGTTRTLQLALGGRQDSSAGTPSTEAKKKRNAGGVWADPLYATLIVVGSAIAVGVLINELTQPVDHPASPSTSTQ